MYHLEGLEPNIELRVCGSNDATEEGNRSGTSVNRQRLPRQRRSAVFYTSLFTSYKVAEQSKMNDINCGLSLYLHYCRSYCTSINDSAVDD